MNESKVDINDIEGFIDEYTAFCVDKTEDLKSSKLSDVFDFYNEVLEKKKELLEMIKKFVKSENKIPSLCPSGIVSIPCGNAPDSNYKSRSIGRIGDEEKYEL